MKFQETLSYARILVNISSVRNSVFKILKMREIKTKNEFQTLHKIWNSLLEKSNEDNIFLTLEWISTWWKHYGNEHQIRVLIAENNDEIISIALLMYSMYRIFGAN